MTTLNAAPARPVPREQLSDDALAASVRAGDEDAFTVLLARYRRMLLSCTRPYFLPGAEPEDLVQEAAAGLYKAALDYCADQGTFAPFARLCVMRAVITAVKNATRGKHQPLNTAQRLDAPLPFENDDCSLLDLLPGPPSLEPEHRLEQDLEGDEFRTWCRTVLSALEWRVCKAYLGDCSYGDIAHTVGLTTKQVDNALQRVRRKLLERFPQRGVCNALSPIPTTPVKATRDFGVQMRHGLNGPPPQEPVLPLTISAIQRAVAEIFGIRMEDMRAKRRTKDVAFPRQVAMYLCRELTAASLPTIGQEFGRRHHTTVMQACDRVKHALVQDAQLNASLNRLVRYFGRNRAQGHIQTEPGELDQACREVA